MVLSKFWRILPFQWNEPCDGVLKGLRLTFHSMRLVSGGKKDLGYYVGENSGVHMTLAFVLHSASLLGSLE